MTISLETQAVSSMNYFFLRTITGKMSDTKVNDELQLFLPVLEKQRYVLKPDIKKELKDEIDHGNYFFGKSRADIMAILDQGIIEIRGSAMPEITNFYMGLLPERFNNK